MATIETLWTLVRDCTDDFRMPVDSCAGIFRDGSGQYWIGWGRGYDALFESMPFDGDDNVDGSCGDGNDGMQGPVETLEEAEDYVNEVRRVHEQTDPS